MITIQIWYHPKHSTLKIEVLEPMHLTIIILRMVMWYGTSHVGMHENSSAVRALQLNDKQAERQTDGFYYFPR